MQGTKSHLPLINSALNDSISEPFHSDFINTFLDLSDVENVPWGKSIMGKGISPATRICTMFAGYLTDFYTLYHTVSYHLLDTIRQLTVITIPCFTICTMDDSSCMSDFILWLYFFSCRAFVCAFLVFTMYIFYEICFVRNDEINKVLLIGKSYAIFRTLCVNARESTPSWSRRACPIGKDFRCFWVREAVRILALFGEMIPLSLGASMTTCASSYSLQHNPQLRWATK